MNFKTKYAILEPGNVDCAELDPKQVLRDLAALTWIDCEFKSENPTYAELDALLAPLYPHAKHWERVAVNSFNGPADMFVDDTGALQGLPVNPGATAIYWTASILHQIAADQDYPPSYEQMQKDALGQAVDRLTVAPQHTPPRIHGRAVLFHDQVWN